MHAHNALLYIYKKVVFKARLFIPHEWTGRCLFPFHLANIHSRFISNETFFLEFSYQINACTLIALFWIFISMPYIEFVPLISCNYICIANSMKWTFLLLHRYYSTRIETMQFCLPFSMIFSICTNFTREIGLSVWDLEK